MLFKRFFCTLITAAVLLCPAAAAADSLFVFEGMALADADTGELGGESGDKSAAEQFSYLLELYLKDHLAGREEDEVLRAAIDKLLSDHPELFDFMADALLSSGDIHSFYLSPEENTVFESKKTFAGTGLVLAGGSDGYPYARSVDYNTPARYAGMKAGDVITAVDGYSTRHLSPAACSLLLRGEKDTEVIIDILRNGEALSFGISRGTVNERVVFGADLDEQTRYIKVSSFFSNNFLSQVVDELLPYMESETQDRIILDLRDNGGGSLQNALDLIDYLVPEKGVPILTLENKDGPYASYSTSGRGVPTSSMVILVNEKSASAAEVCAYILQEYGYAAVVGTVSYGKGTGQNVYALSNGGAAYITSLIIKSGMGTTYNGVGVIPDIEVANTEIPALVPKMRHLNHGNYTDCVLDASGDAAYALNERLLFLGYLTEAGDTFTQSTRAALAALQTNAGFTVSGELDLLTFQAITDTINTYKNGPRYSDDQLAAALEAVKKFERKGTTDAHAA